MTPRVSVVVVTYNSSQIIEDCLIALNSQTFNDFEVLLVDNDSHDNTRDVIERLRPQLKYLLRTFYLDENKGFTGGNNHAFKFCSSEYVALINPDAFAYPDWLATLVSAMDNHPDAGIGASKLVAWGTGMIDSVGIGFSTLLKGFNIGEGNDEDDYKEMKYVFGACGGAAIYRKKMLDEIGLYDDDFFLIHEDVDLSLRAQMAGWKALYVPDSKADHKVRSCIGKLSDTAIYYSVKNVELVRIKNLPMSFFIIFAPQVLIGAITEFLYFGIQNKKLKLYFKAKIDALKLFPKMIKKRKGVFALKRVNNRYIRSLFTPIFDDEFFFRKIKKLF